MGKPSWTVGEGWDFDFSENKLQLLRKKSPLPSRFMYVFANSSVSLGCLDCVSGWASPNTAGLLARPQKEAPRPGWCRRPHSGPKPTAGPERLPHHAVSVLLPPPPYSVSTSKTDLDTAPALPPLAPAIGAGDLVSPRQQPRSPPLVSPLPRSFPSALHTEVRKTFSKRKSFHFLPCSKLTVPPTATPRKQFKPLLWTPSLITKSMPTSLISPPNPPHTVPVPAFVQLTGGLLSA